MMTNQYFQGARTKVLARQACVAICFTAAVVVLTACSSGTKRPQPAELTAVTPLVAAPQLWTSRVGLVTFPLQPGVASNTVSLASDDGTVAMLDAKTGRDIWRVALATAISAGVGSDGVTAAVVTKANELVTLRSGRELWRQKLLAQTFTAPFIAGGRVFVLTADRSVNAFDGETGRKLWTQQRPNEPLILKQGGVMLAVGDTLVVGLAGRLAGLNPLNGSVRWEAPIATPRGINDVERLVDLVGGAYRENDTVCARAFQASIGCVNAARGNLLWTKPARGIQGLGGDGRLVFGSESDGNVIALKIGDGEKAWTSESLRYRSLSAPVTAGRSVVLGDSVGFLHLLSRDDGSLLNRLTTDGSAILVSPVMVGNTMVVVTRNGGVFGYQPE